MDTSVFCLGFELASEFRGSNEEIFVTDFILKTSAMHFLVYVTYSNDKNIKNLSEQYVGIVW